MQSRKMKDNCLIWLFSISSIFSYLSTTNGNIFFPFARPIPYSIFQEQNLNKADQNDDLNPLPPFPPFFTIFRRQSFYPFSHFFGEDKETKENKTLDSSVKQDVNSLSTKAKGNVSLDDIVNSVTKQVKNEINTTQVLRKKILEKMPFLGKFYDPFNLFRRSHSRRHSGIDDNKIEKNEQTMKQISTKFSKIGMKQALSQNNIVTRTETTTNNVLLVAKENCTHRHFIRRYLFVWRFNWTSFAVQFTVILLILTIVTFGVLLCRPYCSEDQYKVHVSGKPLHI